jgi:hypothetical protein
MKPSQSGLASSIFERVLNCLMDPTNQPVGPGELLPAQTNQSIGADFFSLSLRAEHGQKESSPRSALLASTEEAAETISPYSPAQAEPYGLRKLSGALDHRTKPAPFSRCRLACPDYREPPVTGLSPSLRRRPALPCAPSVSLEHRQPVSPSGPSPAIAGVRANTVQPHIMVTQ